MEYWLVKTALNSRQIADTLEILGISGNPDGDVSYWAEKLRQQKQVIAPLASLFAVQQVSRFSVSPRNALAWWKEYFQGYLGLGATVVVEFALLEVSRTVLFYGLAQVEDAFKYSTMTPGTCSMDLTINMNETTWVPQNKNLFVLTVQDKRPETILQVFQRRRHGSKAQMLEMKLPQDRKNEINMEARVRLRHGGVGFNKVRWCFWQHDQVSCYTPALYINWERTRKFHVRLPTREWLFRHLPRELVDIVLTEYLDDAYFDKITQFTGKRLTTSIDHLLYS